MANQTNLIARQLYAMSKKKKGDETFDNLRNERYQRTMTDSGIYARRNYTGPRWIDCANLFIPATDPRYPAMVKRAEKSPLHEWRADPDRPGIWVTQKWVWG